MLEMYKGVVNSPETTITNDIDNQDTLIYILDDTVIPDTPNLMTLGTGRSAETVRVIEISGNMLTVERGFQGVPRSWNAGTIIARNFTEYDYNALKENIEGLDENIGDLDELDTTEKDNIVGAINEVKDDVDNIELTADNVEYSNTESGLEAEDVQGAIDEVVDDLDTHLADNTTAHGIDGILSELNNLNANDSEVRKELLDLKLKLDEKDVIDFISSKSGIGFYDLFTNNDYVDTVNTTATIANTNVIFPGTKVLKMKPQTFDNFSKLELAIYDKNREKIAANESVVNSTTIKASIGAGSMVVGDKLFYKGVTYTVQSVAEA